MRTPPGARAVAISGDFAYRVPGAYADRIRWDDASDPLHKMVRPDPLELSVQPYERADPIQDALHSPVPGLVHRHPDRCLLLVTSECAVHCRFCFRKNRKDRTAFREKECLAYLRAHTEIREVIFSGGDPLVLGARRIRHLVTAIRSVPHVRRIRFHSRLPVVDPDRLTPARVRAIASAAPVSVVLHINHPREWTPRVRAATDRLRSAGILLLSQSVLLKGVNDNADILEELFQTLVEAGVKPYYLHHLDPAAGTDHFRVSMKTGRSILRRLRARLSGVCVPLYVVDLPDLGGKIPVESLRSEGRGTYALLREDGSSATILDPADPEGGIETPDPAR